MFFDIKLKKEIVMVNVISVEEMSKIDMSSKAGGVKTKYPWDTTSVGGGFSIPLSDMKKTNNRPGVPLRLLKVGVKYISRKLPVNGVPSIVLQRVA